MQPASPGRRVQEFRVQEFRVQGEPMASPCHLTGGHAAKGGVIGFWGSVTVFPKKGPPKGRCTSGEIVRSPGYGGSVRN